MKIGLVLEGGAMRGMYTAGVLDTFMDNNIRFEKIVGTSAGALFGVNFLSNQKGRAIRYNKRFNHDKNYMGLLPLLKEGNIVSTKYAYDAVPRKLDVFDDETYKKSEIPFYAVITDIENGLPEYVQIKSVFEQMDTLRASGSMPFVSKPVNIDGKFYLDGSIADSIPYNWLLSKGCDKVVVILTRDKNYRKKPTSEKITRLFYNKYPYLANRILKRHEDYNQSVKKLEELENDGRAFVIRPSKPIKIKRVEADPDKLQEVYDFGVNDCKALLSNLMEYMKQ